MTYKTEGPRWDRHPIVRRGQRCVAVLADGSVCDRWLNHVAASDGKRYWRHGPRPYYNTHEMRRRR